MAIDVADFDFGEGGDLENKFDRPKEGRYILAVNGVQQDMGQEGDQIWVDCEVLSGTTPNQEGKSHREFFRTQDQPGKKGNRKRLVLFALATGITNVNELRAAQAKNTAPPLDFDLAVGRRFAGQLTKGQGDNVGLNFNIWSTTSPDAADIPKPSNGSGGNVPPSSSPSSPPADNPFGDSNIPF